MRRAAVAVIAWTLAGCPAENNQQKQDLAVPEGDLATAPDLSVAPDLSADAAPMPDASGDAAITCLPQAFLRCNGNAAIFCNGAGNAEESFDCGQACTGSTDMGIPGCGQCAASSCASAMFKICDAHGKLLSQGSCVTLQAGGNTALCSSETSCMQCQQAGGGAITSVCGDGVNHGTIENVQYECTTFGELLVDKRCRFGCNPTTGACSDLEPANQARANLAGGDSFSCLSGAASTLEVIQGANAGVTYTFNTTTREAFVSPSPTPGPIIDVRWSAGTFTPTGSNATAVVAHVRRVSLSGGAKLKVVGANMLILVVDESVSLMGGTDAVPTSIEAAGVATTVDGPGAKSAQANTTQSVSNGGGGAGAGHATAGGMGGNGNGDSPDSDGPSPGPAYGMLGVLTSGSRGGDGALWGAGAGPGGAGGGGGGGLQISACGAITVGSGVLIDVSGGGGAGGGGANAPAGTDTDHGGGGGGGGSGGGLILEGSTVVVNGRIVANGGGGGEGGSDVATDMTGDAADSWGYSTVGTFTPVATADFSNWTVNGKLATPAGVPGGSSSDGTASNNGGIGATAPAASPAPGSGGATAVARFGGGGGGGAMGRISFHVGAASAKPTLPANVCSPLPSLTRACTVGTTCSYTLLP